MAPSLWTRRDEHDVTDATARWKNIGIIVACIAGVILLLWILYESPSFFQ
jgi:hypothetical protein